VVCGDPFRYRDYVQRSRGELSCAKPSCVRFQNAWISDRSLCYLASGRPVVVEHTGPSDVLDAGAGLLRFSSVPEAVAAIAEVEARYEHHRRAARELVEAHFDATEVLGRLLDHVCGAAGPPVDVPPGSLEGAR
jgi:glycosyltransferase involved in cell wall biosynthesis